MLGRSKSLHGTSKPLSAVSVKGFELPALHFNFSSLTDGTNIPPPLPSPVEEKVLTPPETPTEEKENKPAVAEVPAKITTNGLHASHSLRSTGTKRPADDLASPTFSTRQGSIRRLFSRNLLNQAYTNGEAGSNRDVSRPGSRMSGNSPDAKKNKRRSWLSRLRSSDSAGNKQAYVVANEKSHPIGPPPPMIPELDELKTSSDGRDEWNHGGDFFKNIK